MQSLDITVIKQARQWVGSQPVWLCTVLSTFGSSPRAPGAMMVATQQGQFCGSLSGGCVEEDFLARISSGDFRAYSQIVRYGDGALTPDRALPCGGILSILIEYLPPSPENTRYLARMADALAGYASVIKRVRLPDACHELSPHAWSSSTQVIWDEQSVTLNIAPAPRLIVAGLSTVALYCSEFAAALGFETLVCENRPEVLANFAHRLGPDVQLIKQFPAKFIEQGGCHSNSAVVALTHDPRVDDLTLMEAVMTGAFYIGAMGSQKNSQQRRRRLKEIAGWDQAELERVHAPIGMEIGSKTPAEIALAVMADIVKYKNHSNR